MQAHDFFLSLLIILLTARVFAELATRLKSPAVIGELFAGVVLLALLYEFSIGGGVSLVNTGKVIVIALTTLLPPFVMKWYYRRYGAQMA